MLIEDRNCLPWDSQTKPRVWSIILCTAPSNPLNSTQKYRKNLISEITWQLVMGFKLFNLSWHFVVAVEFGWKARNANTQKANVRKQTLFSGKFSQIYNHSSTQSEFNYKFIDDDGEAKLQWCSEHADFMFPCFPMRTKLFGRKLLTQIFEIFSWAEFDDF